MERYAANGRRPYHWWLFEAEALGIKFNFGRDWERQAAILYEHDWLEPDERAMLLKHWRRDFDAVQYAGFQLQRGTTLLQGFPARRAYYQDGGIPRSLIIKWEAAPHGEVA
jgi:hypothetical protein